MLASTIKRIDYGWVLLITILILNPFADELFFLEYPLALLLPHSSLFSPDDVHTIARYTLGRTAIEVIYATSVRESFGRDRANAHRVGHNRYDAIRS